MKLRGAQCCQLPYAVVFCIFAPLGFNLFFQPQDDWNIGATILSSGHYLYHGFVGFF